MADNLSKMPDTTVTFVHRERQCQDRESLLSVGSYHSRFGKRIKAHYSIIMNILWRIFDNIVMLQMASTYLTRFEDFAAVSKSENLEDICRWRMEQQDEWNRLSTSLALLATMQAATLALSTNIPDLAFSLWLGGASLSVCGVFVVQYFPIKAFSISDEDMGNLVQTEENHYISATLLATAVASPVVILLWSTILFVVGMFDYISESNFTGMKYRLIAGIPLGVGVLCMILTMITGEVIDVRIKKKAKIF